MNTADAEDLARELMREFGLTADGWSFRFDAARKRFGACKVRRDRRTREILSREITLSRALTVANDRANVEDTLRHEIAHALAGINAGHGPRWREACAVTGARPQRCYSAADVKPAAGTYRFVCEGCGANGTRTRRYSPAAFHCRDAALRWERVA